MGALVLVAIVVISFVCVMRKRKQPFRHLRLPKEVMPSVDATQVHTTRQFSYDQLSSATDNFSASRLLGKGSFGAVYKAETLADLGISVAVKRIFNIDERAIRDYIAEIKIISHLSHLNLVPFVGSCTEDGELLLVYELMQNNTLDYHLHNNSATVLSWNRRYTIALDMASALVYLHKTNSQGCVLHRDIKPSNVMLDEHFNAKVGDFGLVRQVDHDRTSHTMTIIGSSSYIDPEYIITGRASSASDIYSFGVVLLEIASGERPECIRHQYPMVNSLIEKVRGLYERNALHEAADGRLNDVVFDIEQMKRVMLVGLLCVQLDHRKRPSCLEVLDYLSGQLSVPQPCCTEVLNYVLGQVSVSQVPQQIIQVRAAVPKEFSYDDLSAATASFSKILGKGAYGEVYEGQLGDISVAVKQIIKINGRAIQECRTEIEVISQLRHRNLLRLVGWCCQKDKLLLVYNLMQKGSLSDHLYMGKHTPLDWEKRFKIIVGIASGLAYLHEGGDNCILHRDIKPSNVMLDGSYNAKLGDFGLVREVDTDRTSQTLTLGGTLDYLEPEYFKTKKACRQSDVYSFGVVMLEMALGVKPATTYIKSPSDDKTGELVNILVDDAPNLIARYKKGNFGTSDKHHRVQPNGEVEKEQMDRVMCAAVLCVHQNRSKRPSCKKVLNYLEGNVAVLGQSSSVPVSGQHSEAYQTSRSLSTLT